MSLLKIIRDSVIARFMPRPKPEAVDPVPLPAEEQQQIEVQEMNTGMVRNNYLMRDYLMSLPEEERQKYIDAQNGNPTIEEYKKSIGLNEHGGWKGQRGFKGELDPDAPNPDGVDGKIMNNNPKKPHSFLHNKL